MRESSSDVSGLKVGIFGVGMMGKQYVRVFTTRPEFDLIGVYDVDKKTVSDSSLGTGISFTDRDTLLELCDVIAIATPAKEHATDISHCLDAGVNTFVAPPFVIDPGRGAELIEIADDRELVIYTAHLDKQNPAITHLYDYLSSAADDLLAVETRRFSPPLKRPISEDIIMNSMVYDLDILCTLLDCSVQQSEATVTSEYGVANLLLESGTVATLKASRTSQRTVRSITVTTREVYIETDLLDQSLSVYRRSSPEFVEEEGERHFQERNLIEQPAIIRKEPLKETLSEFLSVMEQRDDLTGTAMDSLQSVELANRLQATASKSTR